MPTRLVSIVIDAADPPALAHFWGSTLDWSITCEDAEESVVEPPGDDPSQRGQVPLLFGLGGDTKTVKNRIHLDLQPEDSTRDETVDRLIGLGATLVGDHRTTDPSGTDGTGWVTLADIEGNEFCVVRSTAERATAGE
jgi:hypothetical protein